MHNHPAKSPRSDARVQRAAANLLLAAAFSVGIAAQQPAGAVQLPAPNDPTAGAMPVLAALTVPLDQVMFDAPGDGSLWGRGATYKASFTTDGFCYVPNLGAAAPRNFPVSFRLQSVTVGGASLALQVPRISDPIADRVTFDHGPVQVLYALAPQQVEQLLTIDTRLPGDVVVAFAVATELVEDPAQPGLQFTNEHGAVHYGTAYVVDGLGKHAIDSWLDGGVLHLRVPAALRGDGPLRIDPILSTTAVANTGPTTQLPDLAYDAGSSSPWLVVWQQPWSATDRDLYWQSFGSGAAPGAVSTVDFTGDDCMAPRVAVVRVANEFLCVFEQTNGNFQGRTQIYGRTRNSISGLRSNKTQLSDNSYPGVNRAPDVGGDPGLGLGEHTFCVAWSLVYGPNDSDIVVRTFRGNLTGTSIFTTFLNQGPGPYYSDVAVSQSNGSDTLTSPRWLVAYSRHVSSTNRNTYGALVDPMANVVVGETLINGSSSDDETPCVSSPITDSDAPAPFFVVTAQRTGQSIVANRVTTAFGVSATTNFTTAFGIAPFWTGVESDGLRMLVTGLMIGVGPIGLTTVGYTNNTYVLQESPQAMPSNPEYVRLCSARSGGGGRTRYGVVYQDPAQTPAQAMFLLHDGRAPGSLFTRRVMSCGIGIQTGGRPFLGDVATFTLSNLGSNELPAFAFGLPGAATTAVCAACPIGLNLNVPISVLAGNSVLAIQIPTTLALVNSTFSVQGIGIGIGSCVAGTRFSDTIDFTVR